MPNDTDGEPPYGQFDGLYIMAYGWYAMQRGWMDDPFFKKHEQYSVREAWVWLIENALFKDQIVNIGGQPVSLKRGQLAYAVRYLADVWGWNPSKVQRYLEKLKLWKKVETRTDTAWQVITICNYDEIQFPQTFSDTEVKQSQTHVRHDRDTNKNKGNQVKKSTVDACADADVVLAFSLYNEMAQKNNLPTAMKLSKKRAEGIKARLRDIGGIDGWRCALEKIQETPFLCGGGDNGWRATLDFIVNEEKFAAIMEGTYDPYEKAKGKKGQVIDAIRRGLASIPDVGDDDIPF